MSCEHENIETIGKFPKNMYINEAGGDNDRLSNDIKCLNCGLEGREEYYHVGYEIDHKDSCEEQDIAVNDVGIFPNNMRVKHDYFFNKIKCYECNRVGKSIYMFENRVWKWGMNNE